MFPDDGDWTETCRSCFNVNFYILLKQLFSASVGKENFDGGESYFFRNCWAEEKKSMLLAWSIMTSQLIKEQRIPSQREFLTNIHRLR